MQCITRKQERIEEIQIRFYSRNFFFGSDVICSKIILDWVRETGDSLSANLKVLVEKVEVLSRFKVLLDSRSQMFFKICVRKNFAKFTGKHLSRVSFLITLYP